jgi:pilus assembly protein CpaB
MRTRLILIAIFVLSLSSAVALLRWSGEPPSAAAEPVVKPEHTVLVAAALLPVGTLIRPEDVEWRPWPSDSVPPHAIDQYRAGGAAPAGDALAEVTGAVVRRALDRGEPILADAIARPGDRGFLAAVLEPGMRALSVTVNAGSFTTGLIYPGDRVDVILTQTFKESGIPAGRRSAGETVAQNLRVLAIDQRLQPARTEPVLDTNRATRTVTLEVTPRQSEQIAVAFELGKLTLTLRSLLTDDRQTASGSSVPTAAAPIWGEDVSSALRANLPTAPGNQPGRLLIMHGSKVDGASPGS